jgi:hypothetical protein
MGLYIITDKGDKMSVIFYLKNAYGVVITSGPIKSVNGKTTNASDNVTIDGADIWLPAVQTLADLEAIIPPQPDNMNYLCRVINDPVKK